MKKRKYTISTMYCTECGNAMPIPRAMCKKREKNHIKTMYCYHCKKKTNFIEQRSEDYISPLNMIKQERKCIS